jgi:hypothetical protein
MPVCPPFGKVSRLVTLLLVLSGLLISGGHVARAAPHGPQDGGDEQPSNVVAIANAPLAVTVYWSHTGDEVFWFDIEEQSQGVVRKVDHDKRAWTFVKLAPNTPYQFRVCAVYDATDTDRVCSDENGVGYASVTTGQEVADPDNQTPPTPWVTGYVPAATSLSITWGTPGFDYDFDSFTIRIREKAAPGAPNNAFRDIDVSAGGTTGSSRIAALKANTTYQIQIRGCNNAFFVIPDCPNSPWGPLSEATTLFAGTIPPLPGGRPTPVISGSEEGDTWVFLLWSVTPRYTYGEYVIQYQPQTAAGGAPQTVVVGGDQRNASVDNLTPGTSYVFSIRGCDSTITFDPNAAPSVGFDDCTPWSAPYTAGTHVPTPATGFYVPPAISLAPATITAGASVTVSGSNFPPADGQVSLGYHYDFVTPTGGEELGSGTLGTATLSAQGTFSRTITLPADIPAASITIEADSQTAKAVAILKVVAASSQGTLTLTDMDGPTTEMEANYDGYTLYGNNLTPGPVTVCIDSPQGTQVLTATVGADGTFQQQAFDISARDLNYIYGRHTLVAVQNGAVQASVNVTIDPPLHVG